MKGKGSCGFPVLFVASRALHEELSGENKHVQSKTPNTRTGGSPSSADIRLADKKVFTLGREDELTTGATNGQHPHDAAHSDEPAGFCSSTLL